MIDDHYYCCDIVGGSPRYRQLPQLNLAYCEIDHHQQVWTLDNDGELGVIICIDNQPFYKCIANNIINFRLSEKLIATVNRDDEISVMALKDDATELLCDLYDEDAVDNSASDTRSLAIDTIYCSTSSSLQEYCAAVTREQELYLWDRPGDRWLGHHKIQKYHDNVRKFVPSTNNFAVVTTDDHAEFWNCPTAKPQLMPFDNVKDLAINDADNEVLILLHDGIRRDEHYRTLRNDVKELYTTSWSAGVFIITESDEVYVAKQPTGLIGSHYLFCPLNLPNSGHVRFGHQRDNTLKRFLTTKSASHYRVPCEPH